MREGLFTRPARAPALAVFAVLLAACGNTAASISPEHRLDPAGSESVVMGRIDFPNYEGGDAFAHELRMVERATGRPWRVALRQDMAQSSGRSVPFFVALPAGGYRLTTWSTSFPGRDWSATLDLDFDVAPGRVLCVGVIVLKPVASPAGARGDPDAYDLTTDVRDDCAQLTLLLRQIAPGVEGRLEIALAHKPSP